MMMMCMNMDVGFGYDVCVSTCFKVGCLWLGFRLCLDLGDWRREGFVNGY